MRWKTLLLLPFSLITLVSPQAQSLPRIIFAATTVVQTEIAYAEQQATTTPKTVNPEPVEPVVKKEVSNKPKLYATLVPVCSCESTGRPYNKPQQFHADGSVIHGRINPLDIGMCQINEKFWLTTAIKLGFDIDTEEGNIRMANYIYELHGLQPWSASKSCWAGSLPS